uniref:(northern house mosquito) hypothetical protein n=1 Tax=Culex pipiens TaxID=7175 RepID=A0A8D8HVW0_CULPI
MRHRTRLAAATRRSSKPVRMATVCPRSGTIDIKGCCRRRRCTRWTSWRKIICVGAMVEVNKCSSSRRWLVRVKLVVTVMTSSSTCLRRTTTSRYNHRQIRGPSRRDRGKVKTLNSPD